MSAPLEDTPIKLAVTLGPAETVEASSPAIPTSKRKRAPKKPAGEATTSRIGRKGAKGSVLAGPSSPHSSTHSASRTTISLPPAAQTASKTHGSYLPNMLLEDPYAPPVRRWNRSVRGITRITGVPLQVKCWKGDPNSAYADYLRSFTEVPPEQLPSSLPPSSVATPLAQFAPTSTVATPNQLEAAVSILAMSHAAPSPDSPAVPPEPSMEDQESVSVAQEDIAVV